MDYREDTDKTMQGTLHTCLLCEESAHECEENTYRCDNSECGFSWKVEVCYD